MFIIFNKRLIMKNKDIQVYEYITMCPHCGFITTMGTTHYPFNIEALEQNNITKTCVKCNELYYMTKDTIVPL